MSLPTPSPKTNGSKQTGFVLGSRRGTAPFPTIDPALCVFAAHPCWQSDGFALAVELHKISLAPSLVRGWFSTVDPDANDYVTPRFERPGGVTLWHALMASRSGWREGTR
jgi:hypothetical protein